MLRIAVVDALRMLNYLPSLSSEIAEISLLLPVANEGSVSGLASKFVESSVYH